MYNVLLSTHSILRWLLLATLLFAIVRAFMGWMGNKPYKKVDNFARLFTVIFAHLQLIVGLGVYFSSPLVKNFRADIGEGMKDSIMRFFGMEHLVMMVIAIIVITVFSSMSKRKKEDKKKFRVMAIGFTIALLIIFASIPWPWMEAGAGRGWW